MTLQVTSSVCQVSSVSCWWNRFLMILFMSTGLYITFIILSFMQRTVIITSQELQHFLSDTNSQTLWCSRQFLYLHFFKIATVFSLWNIYSIFIFTQSIHVLNIYGIIIRNKYIVKHIYKVFLNKIYTLFLYEIYVWSYEVNTIFLCKKNTGYLGCLVTCLISW